MRPPIDTRATDTRRHILDTGRAIMAGKGYSAVGLNEILTAAGVPKGSFYHYFPSKDAFGDALLQAYFTDYLAELDAILTRPGLTVAQRLAAYWQLWRDNQESGDCQGRCLAVKLGAEVADLSDAMRQALRSGTTAITDRLAQAIINGRSDGSLAPEGDPAEMARTLYQLWLGASLMAKITRDLHPFDTALAATRRLLRPTSA